MVAPNPHRAGEEAEAQRGHGGKGGAGTPGRRPQVLPSQGTEGGGPGLAFGFQRSAELGEQANMRRCQPRRPASVKRAAAPVERRRPASGGPRVCPCHLTRSLPHHRGCEWALRAHCSPHPKTLRFQPLCTSEVRRETSFEATSQATIHTSSRLPPAAQSRAGWASPCPIFRGGH